MTTHPAGLCLEALGVPIAVEAEPGDLPRLRHQWARCRTDRPAAVTVRHGPVAEATTAGGDAADYALATTVTLTGLEAGFGRRLALHAAGLASASGAVLALVAGSGAGKSTASRVLGRRLGYVSDETVSIDPETRLVLPYPKPLSLASGEAAPDATVETASAAKTQHAPDDLALLPLPDAPLRLGRVVLLAREPDRRQGLLEAVPLLDALIEVVPHTSALPRLPHPLATLAGVLAATGGAVRVRYTEIDDAADDLVALAAPGRPATTATPTFEHVPGPPGGTDPAERRTTPHTGARVQPTSQVLRTPHTDAVVVAGESVVLVGEQTFRLSGVACALWLATPGNEPASVARLTRSLVAALGPDVRAEEHTVEAVRLLAEAGLVTVTSAGGVDADPRIERARG